MRFSLRAIKDEKSFQQEFTVRDAPEGNVVIEAVMRDPAGKIAAKGHAEFSARGAFDLADALTKCGAYSEDMSYEGDAKDEEIAELKQIILEQHIKIENLAGRRWEKLAIDWSHYFPSVFDAAK